MECELCGKNTSLVKARIEGSVLDVCRECSKLGEVIETPSFKKLAKKTPRKEKGTEREIASDYYLRIKRARERKSLNLKEFAQKIREKESVLKRIENKELVPEEKLAKKLEKALGISLYEEMNLDYSGKEKKKYGGLTIGDVVRVKVKK